MYICPITGYYINIPNKAAHLMTNAFTLTASAARQAAQAKADRRAEALARRADRLAGVATELDDRRALYSNVGN